MLIQFKDKCFELDKENNVVLSSSQVPKLKKYLPNDLNIDQPDHFLPPAPDRDFMNSDGFNKQLKSLFDTNHLQLIQSTYFGPRESKESTLQKSPLNKALVDHIPPKNEQRQSLDVYIIKQALVKYIVNFINLWNNPKRLNNLLNRLLRVPLKIHLAPIREKKLKNFVEKKKLKREEKLKHNKDLTMSDYPSISKERDKFTKKSKKDYANAPKWLKRAERCDGRIKTYSEVLKEEEGDDSEELELEISSEHNPVSINDLLLLEDKRPLKNTDLPFVLMANQVFNNTGYSEKALRICPFTSPGHLNALSMDASAISSLFYVRVSETLIRNTSSNSRKAITQKIDSKVTPKQLSISAKKDINDRIALLKAESNALELQLKNAVQTRTNHIITSDIKEHHKLLTKRHNNEVMVIRENLKATKSRICNLQKQLNFSEYGKDFTKKDENIVKKFEITKENYKCFERTEDIELDEQVRYSEDLLSSGTDNGLVTMTETTKLNIKQVKFHLKLFNKYSILNDIKEDDQDAELNFSDDDINQATLCKTFKVHSSDLQFRGGVKISLMKLEKLKKRTEAEKL
ncbi:hypothetical protein INT48_006771 [Thamnidium elegans]|uniref:Uncharacterized protein n=1 Tax=Thamnidium elegans TaxID=101142 RepID=A0A8H7SI85_9FUNG|nr:hypothetical protein INT48_006771 [Thamnidium elegans]